MLQFRSCTFGSLSPPSSLPAATPPFLGFRFLFTSLPLARRQPAGLSFCAPPLSSSTLPHPIPLVWIILFASVFCSAVDPEQRLLPQQQPTPSLTLFSLACSVSSSKNYRYTRRARPSGLLTLPRALYPRESILLSLISPPPRTARHDKRISTTASISTSTTTTATPPKSRPHGAANSTSCT